MIVAGALVVVGCGSDVRWVSINRVDAAGASATELSVQIDVCAVVPYPRVVESATEVHLLIDLKMDYSSQKACVSAVDVHLAQPIGNRKVIDDRHHRQIPVTSTPPITPVPHLTGSVHQLLGRDADATVTAWLLIDASGAGVLCDDLPPEATVCSSPTMQVDWTAGGLAPPTDLPKRANVSVSAGLVTLEGSLKDDTLYVGVKP